jgi:putative membrane protein
MISTHMAFHIAAMNVVAPIFALAFRNILGSDRDLVPVLLCAAVVLQIFLLWAWHLPEPMRIAADRPAVMAAMHGSLFLAALFFWRQIVKAADNAAWLALGGLLITGKLFCLLGVLLTFAPRTIYTPLASMGDHALADQQLAGLIMLATCPVTYIGAAVVIAIRWLDTIDREPQLAPAWSTRTASG